MSKLDEATKARNTLASLAADIESMKIRPWNVFKVMKALQEVQVNLLQLCGELLTAYGTSVDGIEKLAIADLALSEKMSKLWAEVYSNEEKRRKMEEGMKEPASK